MALDLRVDLFGRSFLTLRDFRADEIEHLLAARRPPQGRRSASTARSAASPAAPSR